MDMISITGGISLNGSVSIAGAKNAALPLMTACLLTDQSLTLKNLPDLADIRTMISLLEEFGVEVSISYENNTRQITLSTPHLKSTCAPYDIVRKMRASILVLGPLLARAKTAKVSLPGGCAIGTRPVDLHIKGLIAMGADIELRDGYIEAHAPQGLKGTDFTFPLISVTGTENLLMAATLAKGTTRLINAAREPEVCDLAHCLKAMGAKISGIGTDTLVIEGTPEGLSSTTHRILPDRIEAGTYAIAAAITGGKIDLLNIEPQLLPNFLNTLSQTGVIVTPHADGISIEGTSFHPQGVDVMTEPFPGFATDLQAQFMALMTICDGASMVTETIFENRFMHVPELQRMGANITVHGASALVRGVPQLTAAPVMATDLRASVSLVLAALRAQGASTIRRIYHLDRGYEKVEEKLIACGAKIERLKDEEAAA